MTANVGRLHFAFWMTPRRTHHSAPVAADAGAALERTARREARLGAFHRDRAHWSHVAGPYPWRSY